MSFDVASLRAFYRSPLGQVVRRQLTLNIRSRWQKPRGLSVAGIGFTSPFLGSFRNEAARIACLMPARQGALVWPHANACLTALVEEHHWPLPDNSIDRLLAVHCLEQVERVAPMLREAWRVLAPDGRLLLIVPNRAGVWSRFDATPFGHGLPFSRGQLETRLSDALLTPVHWGGALFFPPFDNKIAVRLAPAFERVGHRLPQRLAGVVIVEARKDLMAPVSGLKARERASPQAVLIPDRSRRSELGS
jgi:SAM-dependent methyltransferase